MNARVHLLISGEVQGVFFRASTRDKAVDLGLKGWIRNLMDGKVECIVEGEKERIEQLIEFCKQGPEGSKVDNIEINWEKPKDEFGSFDIRI
ncbi:MAG: acylphosphatase [Candidatus Aenigmarchaeota archaeon]|nr:acylphosphatase [Candidatus Aenigmarchaeota archaeon]NIQ18441.1 acylphosphatase [Candidatus Aenigmarchaeota archaeon]NIS73325.1 acylphosphatase [Candidatus Aenigmarchaeota archaeon]